MKFSTASLVFVLACAPSVSAFVPAKHATQMQQQRLTTPTAPASLSSFPKITTRLQEVEGALEEAEETVEKDTATTTATATLPTNNNNNELAAQKKELLRLLGNKKVKDPVLADPLTKEPVEITTPGVLFGGDNNRRRNVQYKIKSASNTFKGSTDTFIDLLEPASAETSSSSSSSNDSPLSTVLKQATPYLPVPLRSTLASLTDGEFVPMRDLFTSPAVSFAYERGWRQNFAVAGFPGPDAEAKMAMNYFAPAAAEAGFDKAVVVDMSCATGM